jgi:hypothetical protein
MASRVGASVTVLPDGRVLVVGGARAEHPGQGDPDAPTALWSPATGTWVRCPGPRQPRAHHVAVALADGRVLVLGGIEALAAPFDGRPLAVLPPELFDPGVGRWSPGARCETLAQITAAVLLPTRAVLAVGTHVRSPSPKRWAAVYDPGRDRWSDAGPGSAIDSTSLARLGTGDVLTAGGETLRLGAPGEVHRAVYGDALLYRTALNAWAAVAPMRQPRAEHLTLALGDGRALVIGGLALGDDPDGIGLPDEVPLASTEIFDTGTGRWSDGPALLTARAPESGAVLADGRVLVVGTQEIAGPEPPFRRACAEILDLSAGTSTPIDEPLTDPLGSLVALPDGRAFAYGAAGDPEAEVYDPATGAWIALPAMASVRR